MPPPQRHKATQLLEIDQKGWVMKPQRVLDDRLLDLPTVVSLEEKQISFVSTEPFDLWIWRSVEMNFVLAGKNWELLSHMLYRLQASTAAKCVGCYKALKLNQTTSAMTLNQVGVGSYWSEDNKKYGLSG